jgi:outer membrane protein OmpA-like peptidoglycan-associated protein
LRITFDFNSASFSVPADVEKVLVPVALRVRKIHLKGRTDSSVATAGNTKIARLRANAARTYLVAHGVDSRKIIVSWTGSGNFIADNSTPEGRAENRRVDIEFLK